jgi:AraC-like DNA-binding protein
MPIAASKRGLRADGAAKSHVAVAVIGAPPLPRLSGTERSFVQAGTRPGAVALPAARDRNRLRAAGASRPAEALVTQLLDIASQPPSRRIAMWQDIVCDVFVGLDCTSDDDDFRGAVARSNFGDCSYTRVESSRQRVFRTPSRIARSREDFLLFAFGRAGAGGVAQDGRETVVQPGEFAFYDTTRPYELRFDAAFGQTILQVPRALFEARIGPVDRLTATTFSRHNTLAPLATDFVLGLAKIVDSVDAPTVVRLSEHALDLVSMAVGEELARDMRRPSTHRAALRYRLKAHIEAHLRDPDLSLAGAAAALGITPRYVNALLEGDDESFGRHVLSRRLQQCRRDLADPAQAHRQIGEIAFSWGFSDFAHFSRTFRRAFDMSPRDFRALRNSPD